MYSPGPPLSPARLQPPINYQELEGGHWTPPTKVQQQRHTEQQLQEQRAPQTSAATRVALLVTALLLIAGLGMGGRHLWLTRRAASRKLNIKHIIQRHNEGRHHGEALHGEHAAFVTKELGLEEMDHAAFDPEVAAAFHEDGLDPEDLGYDDDFYDEVIAEDSPQAHEEGRHGEGDAQHTQHTDEHARHDGYGSDAGEQQHAVPHIAVPGHVGAHKQHTGLHAGDEAVAPHVPHPHHVDSHHRHQAVHHSGGHGGGGAGDTKPLETTTEENFEEHAHTIKVRERIQQLFPLIDADHSGAVSAAELLAWNHANGLNTTRRRAEREFTWADTDKDGRVALAEYLADMLPEIFIGNETAAQIEAAAAVWANPENAWIVNNKRIFRLADGDGDGALNRTEHFEFQHPEESGRSAMHVHLLAEDIRDRSSNHSSATLGFVEFHESMWNALQPWSDAPDAQPDAETERAEATVKFSELDTDKDGRLSAFELEPIFRMLHPTEADFARMQAKHMMESSDDNSDGSLTQEEMINNPYVFYASSIDEEDESHDEF